MDTAADRVIQILEELQIPFQRYEHAPVYTVAEAENLALGLKEEIFKNLFVRNRKGDRHYLVILKGSKRVDLKSLGQSLKESGLSFASPERLMKYLQLTPGAVSPFGLINDTEKEVTVVLDADIPRADQVNFHPNVNTATLTMTYGDWARFLAWCGNPVICLEIEQ